jgi:hypothetical protein
MDRDAVILLQDHLAALGLRTAPADGIRDETMNVAVETALDRRPGDLGEDWIHWSAKRKNVALLQILARDRGFDPGPVDGWWGPRTDDAVRSLLVLVATGSPPRPWRDDRPSGANPNGWPDEHAVEAFFGPPGRADGSFRPPLVRVPCPWTLKLAWNMNQTRRFLWCHDKAAVSLGRVLDAVLARYGEAEIERLRLNVFSGDYAPRPMRGGTRASMHSWGIAFDFDDENNRLEWGRDRATFARDAYRPWWEAWEAEGWVSLGRARNFDWMHVQAARV